MASRGWVRKVIYIKEHKFLNFPSKLTTFNFVESFKDPHNKEYTIVDTDSKLCSGLLWKWRRNT